MRQWSGGEGREGRDGSQWCPPLSLVLALCPAPPAPAACVATDQTRQAQALVCNDTTGDTFPPRTTPPYYVTPGSRDLLLTADRAERLQQAGADN